MRINGYRGTHSHYTFVRRLALEALEPRRLLAGFPVITEFMARNEGFFKDGDGNTPDWIEIQNIGDMAVDLYGYRLTDDPKNLARWVFPRVLLDPGKYLVVFASASKESNHTDSAGNLHTTFALSADGEYLALVAPDGTIQSQFAAPDMKYPKQLANVSYGVAQETVFANGDSDAEYMIPRNDAVDAMWVATNFLSKNHGFVAGSGAMGFDTDVVLPSSFSAEISTVLPFRSHAVYSRIEFDVDDVSVVNQLTLQMQFDNGFVAYLNGTKIAEANAPDNVAWYSLADGDLRSDSDALAPVDFDITEYIPHLTNGTNILAIHGMNHLSDRRDFLIVPRLVGSVNGPTSKVGYMNESTPGSLNTSTAGVFAGTVEVPQASTDGGFFDRPIVLRLSTPTPDSEIRYTTDGSLPSWNNGIEYTKPIDVETTTTLRIAAFKEDHLSSNVLTRTYLFHQDVIRQPREPMGFPSQWGQAIADYEMDPRIVNDAAYRDEIINGLQSVRTISIVMDPNDLFGQSGIYSNPNGRGKNWERPASVEIIHPDGEVAADANAGIRIHGNITRLNIKKSFRLSFRSEFGPTKLEYPLFPDAPVDHFDNIVLRAGERQSDAQIIRNSFARDTARDMGSCGSDCLIEMTGRRLELCEPALPRRYPASYLASVDSI